jgi:Na+/H+ antiporter NhaD/arsenite permease-like protein
VHHSSVCYARGSHGSRWYAEGDGLCWLTGVLSAFLDNGPAYLVFFEPAELLRQYGLVGRRARAGVPSADIGLDPTAVTAA